MKFIVLAIFMVLNPTAAQAFDTSPIYNEADAQSKFRDAQLHVKKLMNAGQYEEASKYMSVYKTLACEAAEQKAGRSPQEGAANCARQQSPGGVNASVLQRQQELLSSEASSNTGLPGVTVMTRPITGSPTMLDSSAPSLLMFDPRSTPGNRSSSTRSEPADPWTGKR